ncbi:FAD binding domain-containing protein [Polynucleobacter sp. IMCC 30228]|uniref:FAD binding domain-containing protein n=1 Tax=Polynucleobacter sp. IMCC 30228 TaxID=2781011 RepID=UPI001F306732|nr:FAD binding domain-containing protein [Polynucleobacter sp. IMCC 30228]
MKAAAFDYIKAQSVPEVLALMSEHGDDARLMAGGQTLLATLNMRLSEPQLLIDITELTELKGIEIIGEHLWVGALVTHTEIENAALVKKYAPILCAAAPHIAHRAIRNLGTWGGSLVYGDPAAEWPACSIAVNATMVVRGLQGERRILASDFFVDLYTTALAPDEILMGTEIPLANAKQVFSFQELARRHGDYAVAGLAAVAKKTGQVFSDCHFVFFSVATTPVAAVQAQSLVNGQAVNAELIAAAVAAARAEIETMEDITNSAAAKSHLVGVLLERALKKMLAE